ncbi:D-lyxose/D-mannose family sugar isomerase [Pedobacter faecalis]|uniref:D-lyxose/D-mannose family sugar isomerase n=1 Tax=Pedobacter faecalis TaxID=3041495 RepID=UPI00254CA847|nr:D-lyxose/D-mannose family sugar isomerase [Pedobacter sp. ELA7]
MKRSEINNTIKHATAFFKHHGWALPPEPRWDVTDFGLADFLKCGLALVNLAEEEEYCEKLMYAQKNQVTPAHTHLKKKEDIICRTGVLIVQLWRNDPRQDSGSGVMQVKVNGQMRDLQSGDKLSLRSGERVTILPGIWHEFYPESDECIIGEVSTANDDINDNFFTDSRIGRFSEIDEDEPAILKLLSDK